MNVDFTTPNYCSETTAPYTIFERSEVVVDTINMNAIDILDSIAELWPNKALYIESIKRTTERTAIISCHIDEMMKIFEILCHQSDVAGDARRYRVVKALYFRELGRSVEEIAEDEFVDRRTIYRYINIACERLSALFFGIDRLQRRCS